MRSCPGWGENGNQKWILARQHLTGPTVRFSIHALKQSLMLPPMQPPKLLLKIWTTVVVEEVGGATLGNASARMLEKSNPIRLTSKATQDVCESVTMGFGRVLEESHEPLCSMHTTSSSLGVSSKFMIHIPCALYTYDFYSQTIHSRAILANKGAELVHNFSISRDG